MRNTSPSASPSDAVGRVARGRTRSRIAPSTRAADAREASVLVVVRESSSRSARRAERRRRTRCAAPCRDASGRRAPCRCTMRRGSPEARRRPGAPTRRSLVVGKSSSIAAHVRSSPLGAIASLEPLAGAGHRQHVDGPSLFADAVHAPASAAARSVTRSDPTATRARRPKPRARHTRRHAIDPMRHHFIAHGSGVQRPRRLANRQSDALRANSYARRV